MKLVLDTNVLVSALLSPAGNPARVLDLILNGQLDLCLDSGILAEYRSVLLRPRFGFNKNNVEELLAHLESIAEQVTPLPLKMELPDEDDRMFIEVAHAARAIIVTGNLRHYPPAARHGVEVYAPAEFLRLLSS